MESLTAITTHLMKSVLILFLPENLLKVLLRLMKNAES